MITQLSTTPVSGLFLRLRSTGQAVPVLFAATVVDRHDEQIEYVKTQLITQYDLSPLRIDMGGYNTELFNGIIDPGTLADSTLQDDVHVNDEYIRNLYAKAPFNQLPYNYLTTLEGDVLADLLGLNGEAKTPEAVEEYYTLPTGAAIPIKNRAVSRLVQVLTEDGGIA